MERVQLFTPVRQVHRRVITLALVVVDLAMLLAATLAATYLRFDTVTAVVVLEYVAPAARPQYDQASVVVALLWLGFLWQGGLYDFDRLFWGSGELSRAARSLTFGLVGLMVVSFALRMPGLSRAWTLIAWVLAIAFVILGRLLIRYQIRRLRRRGKLQRLTLVVGSNAEAADLIRVLKSDPGNGFHVVGYLTSFQSEQLALDHCSNDAQVLGSARDLSKVVAEHGIDTVIIASTAFDHDVLARMINELRGLAVDIHISSGLFEVLTSRVLVRELSGVPVVTVKGVSFSKWKMIQKRTFDIVVASAIVLIGMPVWLLVAALIKLDSRGPVFYRQTRVGRGGAVFGMLKFRSMYDGADAKLEQLAEENEASGPLFKIKDDPRVTRVGRWLRKFSIDEFPQLLNVLAGEMSLVGPRPPLVHETKQYTDYHWRRMEVLPGMTGLWQVSGRSSLTFEEMVRLDLFYIENWSLSFDLAILMRTIPAVAFARGAY